MPECATSLEDNSLLVSLSAEQLSSNTTPQLRCGEAQAPYCADNEILVICTPNKVFVGYVNCSVQQWAKVSPNDITIRHLGCCMLRFLIIQITSPCFGSYSNLNLQIVIGGTYQIVVFWIVISCSVKSAFHLQGRWSFPP
jgi:hypothetical protein